MNEATWYVTRHYRGVGGAIHTSKIDIENLDDYDPLEGANCSNCNESAFYDDYYGAMLSKYCPNCGAKMLNDIETLERITNME